jgi:hypothetical protein
MFSVTETAIKSVIASDHILRDGVITLTYGKRRGCEEKKWSIIEVGAIESRGCQQPLPPCPVDHFPYSSLHTFRPHYG